MVGVCPFYLQIALPPPYFCAASFVEHILSHACVGVSNLPSFSSAIPVVVSGVYAPGSPYWHLHVTLRTNASYLSVAVFFSFSVLALFISFNSCAFAVSSTYCHLQFSVVS